MKGLKITLSVNFTRRTEVTHFYQTPWHTNMYNIHKVFETANNVFIFCEILIYSERTLKFTLCAVADSKSVYTEVENQLR